MFPKKVSWLSEARLRGLFSTSVYCHIANRYND